MQCSYSPTILVIQPRITIMLDNYTEQASVDVWMAIISDLCIHTAS